jgi:NAD(P)-dependent dehydrogenase (short-subunit alcohol dehydrogenase family)
MDISSVSGLYGELGAVAYIALKHGIFSLAKFTRYENARG